MSISSLDGGEKIKVCFLGKNITLSRNSEDSFLFQWIMILAKVFINFLELLTEFGWSQSTHNCLQEPLETANEMTDL